MLTAFIFIVLLGLLVFVHELGHFLVAKWNGITSHEFGFGFPPRLCGVVKDDATGKYRFIWGNKDEESKNTIYSLNWIPLGGFVRIKGEDGSSSDPDSFAGKTALTRIKVLGAGVFMNFVFAWFLISVVFMLGFPQPVEPGEGVAYKDSKIQIVEVKHNTPAEMMGLQLGDQILRINNTQIKALADVSENIAKNRGKEIAVDINRFGEEKTFRGTPRTVYPENEGSLGISFSETATVSYPWYEALYRGLISTYDITKAILMAFGKMIAGLFGAEKVAIDVTGPVGIVYLTKQMSDLGFSYLLQFAAILSINLGIINILPIPALDGGRILFVLIEKLKGSPVSRKVEGLTHQIGFILLLFLMLWITLRDFSQFQIFQKISSFF